MAADFHQILAGVAAGIVKEGEQGLVEHLALSIDDSSKEHSTLLDLRRNPLPAKDRVGDGQRLRAADTDHGKSTLSGRRGQSRDRLLHGYDLTESLPSAARAFSSSIQRRF